MIDQRCIGPDVDRSKISPDAQISGSSYLTGARTLVQAGAIVRDSRLHDTVVEEGARVIDSISVAEGKPRTHKCDPAGRTVVTGAELPRIAKHARITGCTLTNTSVGQRTHMTDTWACNSQVGSDSAVTNAKLVLVNTGSHVTIAGPTEVSEAYLGDYTTMDRRGYFEGAFSNTFRQLRFNESTGKLEVIGTINLPHVSRYGTNTVNSSNSGKLLPQPDGILKGFGRHVGLWHDALLSHEPIELSPCCWVAPWTKVVGQSPLPHGTDEEMINDELFTYLMPFSVGGFGGDLTRALVMPGELSVGLGPKQRRGAWVFTYAPDAVIKMVRRLHEALEPERKHVADTIVVEALLTAIEMTKGMAARNRVDLRVPPEKQRPGWGRWIATTYALLSAHMEGELWEFEGGEPKKWRMESGKWTHPRMGRLLSVAPDALEKQVRENEIFNFEDPVPPARVAVPVGSVEGTGGDPEIDPDAKIAPDAFVGPGARIGPGTVLESGASVWNAVLKACTIGANSRIERSTLCGSTVGANTSVRSSRITESTLGEDSTADAASIASSRLAPKTTVSAFADLVNVKAEYGTILGGIVRETDIGTYLMSMHMAGGCEHLKVVPTLVELDGKRVAVPAIPMLGGGALIQGTQEAPVEMECCFIGSNAIIERNTYVGFGCFVLGELGPDAGILPFTVSTGGGPSRHQIGGALGALGSTIITHFINWTYQAVGPQGAEAVAEMTRQAIQQGIHAIEWELTRRSGGKGLRSEDGYARYRSLTSYSDQQLQMGLRNYRRALESGSWEIACRDGELWFSSKKGHWVERNGAAFWKAANGGVPGVCH